MIHKALIFTEYRFVTMVGGTDHLEGNQWTIDRAIGKDIAYFHNKKGGVLKVIFVGEISTIKKANVLHVIEETCHLKFIGQEEAQYRIEYEKNLRSMFGDKLVVKE